MPELSMPKITPEMSKIMKKTSASAKVKTISLMLLLALESYFITSFLLSYIQTQKYFSPPLDILGKIAGLLLLLLYTYFLTVGAWKIWQQYVIVPLPIAVGIFLATFQIDTTYALFMFVASYLLIAYDVFIATNLRNLMIKFKPRYVLRFSTRGILFVFALLAGVLVLIQSSKSSEQIDLGKKIGELTQEQYEKFVEPELNESAQRVLINELDGNLPADPEMFSMLSGLTGTSNSYISGLPGINLDLRKTVEDEFNSLIEPYKQFLPPLIALIVFALIRFVGTVVHVVFNITIDLIMKLFIGMGFLKIYNVAVKKEEIGFDAATA